MGCCWLWCVGNVFFLALIHDHIKELKFEIYGIGMVPRVFEIDLATFFYSFFFSLHIRSHEHIQIMAKKVEN